jgi:hypothetical protein
MAMGMRRLRINQKILSDLIVIQQRVNALVEPEGSTLSPELHEHARALNIYLRSWVKPPLDRTIDAIQGTATR